MSDWRQEIIESRDPSLGLAQIEADGWEVFSVDRQEDGLSWHVLAYRDEDLETNLRALKIRTGGLLVSFLILAATVALLAPFTPKEKATTILGLTCFVAWLIDRGRIC